MMANQRGADTVVMIQPTTTAMSPTGIMPPNMPPENNPAILKANSQQRTISALSAHGRPRHRKWLSANSATDTTLRQQKPTNTANSMYRWGLKKYPLSVIHKPMLTQPTAPPINFGHVMACRERLTRRSSATAGGSELCREV